MPADLGGHGSNATAAVPSRRAACASAELGIRPCAMMTLHVKVQAQCAQESLLRLRLVTTGAWPNPPDSDAKSGASRPEQQQRFMILDLS